MAGASPAEAIVVRNLWQVFPRKEGISISSADVMDEQRVREMDESDDTVVAMKDVCLTVYEGETFIIMGLSGSGKSTLIRCLLRLVEPTSGEVCILGHNVTAMGKRELVQFRREKISIDRKSVV